MRTKRAGKVAQLTHEVEYYVQEVARLEQVNLNLRAEMSAIESKLTEALLAQKNGEEVSSPARARRPPRRPPVETLFVPVQKYSVHKGRNENEDESTHHGTPKHNHKHSQCSISCPAKYRTPCPVLI